MEFYTLHDRCLQSIFKYDEQKLEELFNYNRFKNTMSKT